VIGELCRAQTASCSISAAGLAEGEDGEQSDDRDYQVTQRDLLPKWRAAGTRAKKHVT
jgi:hypothetical protein